MDDEDGLHQFDYAIQQRSTAWWADPISGCPSSLEETVMYLLEAGFTPQKLPVLKEKLEKVIKPAIKRHIQSYRIDVPMSLTAFIIPDPFGILQPGEVYFKASHQNLASPSGIDTDLVLGDVLWKAVNYPRLSHLVDVIILPILGSRRAADLLAGGDYDGDKALLIWQPEVVEHFINASLHFSIEPPEVKAAFFKEKKTVTDFLEETRASSPEETQLKLQQYLLGALNQPSLVGQYSNFHLNSIYVNGYQHPETIRLAYMFCKVLDSSKSGEQVLSAQVKHDSKLYNKRPPFWKETEEERSHHQTNEINLIRPKEFHGNEFIMDTIYNQAKEEGRLVQQRIEQAFAALPKEHVVDLDLQQPWKQAEALGKQMTSRGYAERAEDLEKIKRHVETMYGSIGSSSADLPSFVAAEQPTTSIFSNEEVALIKASYAYIFDHQENSARKGWTRFPWDVAMRTCAISRPEHSDLTKPSQRTFTLGSR
ncbi:RNA dependent RNA polymerase-domain-containing protein [Salix suchowensis]|nr:RNA dependent RNA polymerase-domain-containing protein [Salix suchowensis]